jgi:uncharacterized protein YjbI with pentapeptide repeats
MRSNAIFLSSLLAALSASAPINVGEVTSSIDALNVSPEVEVGLKQRQLLSNLGVDVLDADLPVVGDVLKRQLIATGDILKGVDPSTNLDLPIIGDLTARQLIRTGDILKGVDSTASDALNLENVKLNLPAGLKSRQVAAPVNLGNVELLKGVNLNLPNGLTTRQLVATDEVLKGVNVEALNSLDLENIKLNLPVVDDLLNKRQLVGTDAVKGVNTDAVLEGVNTDAVLEGVNTDAVLETANLENVNLNVPVVDNLVSKRQIVGTDAVLKGVNTDAVLEGVNTDAVLETANLENVNLNLPIISRQIEAVVPVSVELLNGDVATGDIAELESKVNVPVLQ